MSFTVHAMFDCYKGLDVTETISIYVKSESKRPIEEDVEDPDINKPTMVESVMETFKGKENDKEAELIEEEATKKTAKGKKRKVKKKDKTE